MKWPCRSTCTNDPRPRDPVGRPLAGVFGPLDQGVQASLQWRPSSAERRNAPPTDVSQGRVSIGRSRTVLHRVLAVHSPEHLPLLGRCPVPLEVLSFLDPLPDPFAFRNHLYLQVRDRPHEATTTDAFIQLSPGRTQQQTKKVLWLQNADPHIRPTDPMTPELRLWVESAYWSMNISGWTTSLTPRQRSPNHGFPVLVPCVGLLIFASNTNVPCYPNQ